MGSTRLNLASIPADSFSTASRTLNLSSMAASVANTVENSTTNGVNGWFAVNQGKLILPSLPIGTGTNSYFWGEDPNEVYDANGIDLVNSIKWTFNSVTQAGTLAVSLLATDHADVTATAALPSNWHFVSVWDVVPADVAFSTADMTARYHDTSAAVTEEVTLVLMRYTGSAWEVLSGSKDTSKKQISKAGLTSSNLDALFAVVQPLGGDANMDGETNFFDYLIMSQNFNATNATWDMGDFDGDGDVDFSDYMILVQHYQEGGEGEGLEDIEDMMMDLMLSLE